MIISHSTWCNPQWIHFMHVGLIEDFGRDTEIPTSSDKTNELKNNCYYLMLLVSYYLYFLSWIHFTLQRRAVFHKISWILLIIFVGLNLEKKWGMHVYLTLYMWQETRRDCALNQGSGWDKILSACVSVFPLWLPVQCNTCYGTIG